jgi:hypothetical protein
MKYASFLVVSVLTAALAGASACGGSSDSGAGSSGASGNGDGGGGDEGGGGGDAGADGPYDTPSVCTSNQHWTRGDRGSSSMHPGGTCIDCHTKRNGPSFSIAGTVFPTAHEPTDCNGVNGTGMTVVITGADGKVTNVPVNSVGNFYSIATIAKPFHAKVVANGKERAMSAAQTSGDCNSCHTEQGANDAPGRIMAP